MKRPDPAHSKVRDIISETMSIASQAEDLEYLKLQGPQLFTEEDINATDHALDQILRRLCVQEHISYAYYAARYRLYSLNVLGELPSQASNGRSNSLKALLAGHITYSRFVECIVRVLGYSIENMSISFGNRKGNRLTITLDDVVKNPIQ